MPQATVDQVKRMLVLWLLFSTGNIDSIKDEKSETWAQVKRLIADDGKLPPGITADMIWKSRKDNDQALHDATGDFQSFTDMGVKIIWGGGGTSCPTIDTIISMFPL